MDWDNRLKLQMERKFDNYKVHRLALDTPLHNKEFPLPGDILIILDTSSPGAIATIRFNRDSSYPLPLVKDKVYRNVFTRFYISSEGQQIGEWLDLMVGIDIDIDQVLADNMDYGVVQPAFVLTNATANQDTQADDHVCKAALIRAISTNSSPIWVNIGAAAVEGLCYEMIAGDVLPLLVTNTSQIHALFKVANERLSILYRV